MEHISCSGWHFKFWVERVQFFKSNLILLFTRAMKFFQVGIQISLSFQIQIQFGLCHGVEGWLIYNCPIYGFYSLYSKILTNRSQTRHLVFVLWQSARRRNVIHEWAPRVTVTPPSCAVVQRPAMGVRAWPVLVSASRAHPETVPRPVEPIDSVYSYQTSYGFASGQIPRRSQGTLLPSSGEPKVSNPWNNCVMQLLIY
jgi:hypothetical protein